MSELLLQYFTPNNGLKALADLSNISPILATNYFAQCYFFGEVLKSCLIIGSKLIHLSLIETLLKTFIVRLAIVLTFVYFKMWNQYDDKLIYAAHFAALFFIAYVYDSCYNIAQFYNQRVFGLYTLQIFLYINICFVCPMFYIYMKIDNYSHNLCYILIAEILIIGFTNAMKMKHIIFSAIISITVLGTVILRYISSNIQTFDNHTTSIPFQIAPLALMAFQAENREKGWDIFKQILLLSTNIIVFTSLNGKIVYLQHIVFLVWLLGEVIKPRKK